jgi:hypothetical protein
MAGVCPACQARKTTSARASAVEPFAQGKAPSALTVQGQGPGSRVAGAEQGDKSMPCALGRALHGGVRSGDDMSKYALPALLFSAHVTAGRPRLAATSGRHRPSRLSEHCHVTVQGLDGAGSVEVAAG